MIKAPDITFVYVVLAFIATFAILKRYLFAPLSAILDAREAEAASAEKVRGESLAALEETISRAEASLAQARGEALVVREKLRGEGRAHLEKRLDEAHASAETTLNRASDEIGASAKASAAELPGRARELARLLAEKILGRKIAA